MNGVNRSARRAAMRKSGKARHLAAASAVAVTGLLGSYMQVLRAPGAYATTLCGSSVTSGSLLDAAIADFNNGGCDTIQIGGSFTLTAHATPIVFSGSTSQELTIVGSSVTMPTINGGGVGPATSRAGGFRPFTVTMDGAQELTIKDLATEYTSAPTTGAANLMSGGSLHVRQSAALSPVSSVLLDNVQMNDSYSSNSGGAAYLWVGEVDIVNSGFGEYASGVSSHGNYGDDIGGAIYVSQDDQGTVEVSNVTFADNSTSGRGGAVYIDNGALSVSGSRFYGNSAGDSAGGIYIDDASYSYIYVADSVFNNNYAADAGGAIIGYTTMAGASGYYTVIKDSSFSHNSAGDVGGALFGEEGSELTLIDGCTFEYNHSDGDGGAIYSYYEVHVVDSTFSHNTADGAAGAVYADDELHVQNSVFEYNASTADDAGAIYTNEAIISDSTFSHNTAHSDGGAGYIKNATITNSTFDANSTDFRGGAFYSWGTVVVTGSSFSGNEAGSNGGAFYNASALTLTETSFTGNSAVAAGVAVFTKPSQSTTLVNSFVGGNDASLAPAGAGTFQGGGDLSLVFSTVVDNAGSGQHEIVASGAGDLSVKGSLVASTTGVTSICDISTTGTLVDESSVQTDSSCGFVGTGSSTATPAELVLSPVQTAQLSGVTQSYRAPYAGSVLLTTAPSTDLGTGVTNDQVLAARSGTFTIGSIQLPGTPPAPPAPPAPNNGGGGSSLSAPSAPVNPSAVPGAGNARVSWQPPASNGGSPVTRYVVTAGPGGAWCAVDAPATSCVVSGLTAGTSYAFTVVAYNAVGASAGARTSAVIPTSGTDPLGPNPAHGSGLMPAGGLTAGASLLLVDGKPAPVTVVPNQKIVSKATGLSVSGPGLTMTLAGRGDVNDPLGLSAKQALVLQSEPIAARAGVAGRMLSLAKQKIQPVAQSTGTGFKADSEVKFFILADTYLGAIRTDGDGTYTGAVPIPAGIKPGTYTLQVNGFAPSGEVRSLSIGVAVVEARTAQATRSASAEVFFAPMSPVISDAGKATLGRLVKKTGTNGVKTIVVGYVQPSGGTSNDAWLSRQRAIAVAEYLRGKGLKGAYVVRGEGRAKQTGPEARRVEVTIAYRK